MRTAVVYIESEKDKEFRREAVKFAKYWGIDDSMVFGLSDRLSFARRRRKTLEFIGSLKGEALNGIAFFCHGWRRKIQAGFECATSEGYSYINDLAGAINDCVAPTGRAILYCCSTAKGWDENVETFAQVFADTLCLSVYAHTGAGHTTRYPYVREYSQGWVGVESHWVVAPSDTARFETWRNELKGDLRFTYPYLNNEQIAHWLSSSGSFRIS